jgi:hypothetical protein
MCVLGHRGAGGESRVGHDRAGDGGCVMCMIFAWILRVRQGGGTGDSVE